MSVYKSIITSLIVVCLCGIVFGFDIPNYEGYITDKVGVFSEAQKSSLTTKIEEIEKTTGIEMAILVVSTVDDDINLAAVDVGNKWGVGKEDQDNGVVLLIAIDDRKRSIQVGYGLEGTIPDLIADRIGEDNFPPNFRNGDYYAGVLAMIDDFLGYIAKDPTIVQKYSQSSSESSFDEDMIGILFFVFIAVTGFFSRWVTVPKTKGTGRKMKKHGRWMVMGVGLVLSLLVTWVIGSFIIALFFSYMFLFFNVLIMLYGRAGSGGGVYGGSSWGGGGSSFGGFSGGSFGGGGSSGSR